MGATACWACRGPIHFRWMRAPGRPQALHPAARLAQGQTSRCLGLYSRPHTGFGGSRVRLTKFLLLAKRLCAHISQRIAGLTHDPEATTLGSLGLSATPFAMPWFCDLKGA